MQRVELKFHSYRYLPYEQRLAELEVKQLLGAAPKQVNGTLQVEVMDSVDPCTLERLTYFRDASVMDKLVVIPQQAQLEASASSHGDPGRLRRQYTRYSAHGLHEYRGKFNPQMVRAMTNLLGLTVGDRVWDPFCGSGTVLLEARHQGFNAVGVDISPLAVAIANAKLSAIASAPRTLKQATKMLIDRVLTDVEGMNEGVPDEEAIQKVVGRRWLERLPCSEYLVRWFPLPVLAQFLVILDSISEVVQPSLQDVFRIILSDVVRDVSWQDPGDLRVRRRKNPAPNYPVSEAFVSALTSRVDRVLSAQNHVPVHSGWQSAYLGDSGEPCSLNEAARSFLEDGIDCVLGSPPYATALPYIDTQRLSIALLGLATVEEIRELDSTLIGSREISTLERRLLEEAMEDNRFGVAEEVWTFCRGLKGAYDPDNDGFRRRNTPAVLYRYFAGMTRVMTMASRYLRRGGWLAFIVGPNRTSLGGNEFLIDTPTLLAATGAHVGLQLCDMHQLNAYSRYDVHSRNSIREERLLVMQRP